MLQTVWPNGMRTIEAGLCDCTVAWLYKDAHKFGFTQYETLVGGHGNNIICDSIGPVLETEDPVFITLMNSCPGNKNIFKFET